jgi:hypothetical protein
MIKHIVFFKLKENSDEQKKVVKERLMSLKDKVEVLKNIEVGINFSTEDRAYDLALLTDFNTKEDLSIYANDEYHQEIIKYIKSVTLSSKVVDYIY